MTLGEQQQPSRGTFWLARRDVLSGLMFAGVALFGLWLSRDYPIGTALRMGTGYVPRLLCWILLGLGVIVLV
jgi:putative tricarboxylic transport membrane protein